MNKNTFIKALKRPASPEENKVENMQFFVQQYPYCQSAQILLAKAYNNTSELGFEKQLRIAAAYAADRQQLHQLIFTKVDREVDVVKPKEALAFNFDYDTDSKSEELVADEIEIEDEVSTAAKDENLSKNDFLKFEIDKLNQKSNSDKNKINPEKEVSENDSLEIDLEKQILTEAIYSSFSIEANEKAHKATQDKEEIEKESPKITLKNEPQSFSDWLNQIDEQDGTNAIKSSDEKENKEDRKVDKTQIIDQFIEKNPQITTKKEFYSPVNMARLSVKENDDLVTETLAKIYAQQGNIDKAISAYEKLALKYPEKRIYFANQINKLGGNLNK